MTNETIKTGVQFRSFDLARETLDEDSRSVNIAFSSEAPVERAFGTEILDHNPTSIRLGRLEGGGPLLVDHDPTDHIGTVDSVSIDSDRVGRAVVRFGKGARASEIFQDVIDGIRKHISVGYRIHGMNEERNEEATTMRVVDWEPLEVSLVSIPADATVGIGRAADDNEFETVVKRAEVAQPHIEIVTETEKMSDENTVSAEQIRADEIHRIREIEAMGEAHGQRDMARDFINSGKGLDEFRGQLLSTIASTSKPEGSAEIGLTEAETKDFSVVRAINALVTNDWTDAGFELEASRAVADRVGKKAQGIYIPMEVQKRDLTVGTATAGGNLVATDLLGGSFIDLLRNKMMVMQAGAQMLTGLTGNVAIPRQSGGATAYWVAENGNVTESNQTFDQVTLSPNTVGAMTDISRRLLLQGSVDVENLIRNDLATTLALELDRAAINGSGSSNQPTGILNVSGIGDVAGGTNGLAPTFAHMIELETDVAAANADLGALGYMTNATIRGTLKQTEKASSTGQFVWDDGTMNGYTALATNQVPSNLTKGTSSDCSAVIFGNWNDLIIGQWGALDILVDPYTGGASGAVRVRAMQDVDIAVRHAASFSAMQDALAS